MTIVNALISDPSRRDPASLTPIASSFLEWKADVDRLNDEAATVPDDQWNAHFAELHLLEEIILAMPCQCAADWICKVHIMTSSGDNDLPNCHHHPALWAEGQTLMGVVA